VLLNQPTLRNNPEDGRIHNEYWWEERGEDYNVVSQCPHRLFFAEMCAGLGPVIPSDKSVRLVSLIKGGIFYVSSRSYASGLKSNHKKQRRGLNCYSE
jgi:hypothetical protein